MLYATRQSSDEILADLPDLESEELKTTMAYNLELKRGPSG
jgi:hypothetical protein